MERINHILPSILSTDKKLSFCDLNIEDVKNYLGEYVPAMFELTNFWNNNLDDKEKTILKDIEIPLSKVLSEMEINGVSIDTNYLILLVFSLLDMIYSSLCY